MRQIRPYTAEAHPLIDDQFEEALKDAQQLADDTAFGEDIDSEEPVIKLQNTVTQLGGRLLVLNDFERVSNKIFCINPLHRAAFVENIRNLLALNPDARLTHDSITKLINMVMNSAVRINDRAAKEVLFELEEISQKTSKSIYPHIAAINMIQREFEGEEGERLLYDLFEFLSKVVPHIRLILEHPHCPTEIDLLQEGMEEWLAASSLYTSHPALAAYVTFCERLYIEALEAIRGELQEELTECRKAIAACEQTLIELDENPYKTEQREALVCADIKPRMPREEGMNSLYDKISEVNEELRRYGRFDGVN